MSAAAKVAVALAKYGRDMVLRRRVGTTAVFVDITVKGVAQGFRPDQLQAGVMQGDRTVTMSNAEIEATGWPGPPRKGDLLLIDGQQTAVQGCETKYLGGAVLAHVLWVRGG